MSEHTLYAYGYARGRSFAGAGPDNLWEIFQGGVIHLT